jgi:signal peptidase I
VPVNIRLRRNRQQRSEGERVVLIRGAYASGWSTQGDLARAPVHGSTAGSLARGALAFVALTVLLTAVLFVIASWSVATASVRGDSMEPAFHDGERLVVNKIAYTIGSPGRGDIIVFRSREYHYDLIKRVIGLPGDTVEIDPDTGTVSIDGQPLDEPYVSGRTTCLSICDWTVPPESYFVMGDNRDRSRDSRDGWFLARDDIIGKALIAYWHDGSLEVRPAPHH